MSKSNKCDVDRLVEKNIKTKEYEEKEEGNDDFKLMSKMSQMTLVTLAPEEDEEVADVEHRELSSPDYDSTVQHHQKNIPPDIA